MLNLVSQIALSTFLTATIEHSQIGLQDWIVLDLFDCKSKQLDRCEFWIAANRVEPGISLRSYRDHSALPEEDEVARNDLFLHAEGSGELRCGQFAGKHQVKHSQANWVRDCQ